MEKNLVIEELKQIWNCAVAIVIAIAIIAVATIVIAVANSGTTTKKILQNIAICSFLIWKTRDLCLRLP